MPIVDGEELLARGLLERAAQALADRRLGATSRQRAAQLGEAAVPERLGGTHDRRVAGAEALGQGHRRQQRRFGAEVDQQLGDAELGRRQPVGPRRDSIREPLCSSCYR